MSRHRDRPFLRVGASLCMLGACFGARAEEVTGKVVWLDEKNLSLLLECPENGCAAIPNAKPGETYTFVVPAALKGRALQLKEGETVKVVYDDAKDKGYVITAFGK